MCLIGIRLDGGVRPFLQIAANRDEFAARPTQPMHWWDSGILAGKDLQAGGTWLGVSRSGRFAAVTNVRDPLIKNNPCPRPSRGQLVTDFLLSTAAPEGFVSSLLDDLTQPSPFNLLVGQITPDQADLWWLGGRTRTVEKLAPGVHVLSNAELNTPWPKALLLKQAMQNGQTEALQSALGSRKLVTDEALPDTGVSRDWERKLSAPMITGADYYTRSSTLLAFSEGRWWAQETTWGPDAQSLGVVEERFELR